MAKMNYTRFEVIYPNRDAALEKLNGISRSYAEPVAIRYYDEAGDVYIIVSIYKSDQVGDYEITYETGLGAGGAGLGRVFTIKKVSEEQTDMECINAALFGEIPESLDIVIIKSVDGLVTTSYIYYDGMWNLLGQGASSDKTTFLDSDTIEMVVTENTPREKTVQANVKIDGKNLVVDEETGKIRVGKIYGGTF